MNEEWDLREMTAYHEAGHFVVGWALHWHAREVSIEPTNHPGVGASLGHTQWQPLEAMTIDQVLESIVISHAGRIATCMRDPSHPDMINEASADDASFVAELLAKFPPPQADEIQRRTLRRAEMLLRVHWCSVEALATELMRRGTIQGADAARIAREA